MENKITSQRLAAVMALSTGKELKICEDFLREFFVLISEQLIQGESVRIKGFGTFKLTDVEARKSVNVATGESFMIEAHRKISFIPSKELSGAVNIPFEVFDAVEITDAIPTNELIEPSPESDSETEPEFDMENEPEFESESEPELTPEVESESDQDSSRSKGANLLSKSDFEEEAEMSDDVASERSYVEDYVAGEPSEVPLPEYEPVNETGRSVGFLWGFLVGVAICAGIGVGLWYFKLLPFAEREVEATEQFAHSAEACPIEKSDSDSQQTDSIGEIRSADSAAEVLTKPSDTVVHDTISRTRFLTTMAREYYGNFNLWPLIYEENKSFLGHPDRIRPGTVVVVPPLSKTGINPNNPEDIRRVKRQGAEIYKRFQ